ncbi:DUF305 domain-containing protein [Mycolicibacterium lacusdiani]|uniref:DUF305 domain-containing protein n=1 Tax=Mycolicibacterium lacusdiani TaxID=2895283 RepID=UPI001F4426B9|nr:DUF305 domain-containing protein [Mycolicibacterium lacusdiani]
MTSTTSATGRIAALVAAAATALFVSACTETPASDDHAGHSQGAESSAPAASGEAPAALPAGVNAADVDFAKGMIPHHEQAVQMSELVPDRSSDPAVIELAAAISKAQEPEIETMQGFLTEWTGSAATGHEGHDMGGMGMQGMVDGATMKRLETLKGAEFDTLWLQSMIGHHEGAIAMANTEIADGANADAKDLAAEIVKTQQAEIDQMKQMLGG